MLKARCVDFLRHSRCEAEAYRKCQLEWQPPDGLALVEQQVLVEQVLEAFPENAREIARLVNEEYSWAETAEALNLSQSAVKMRFWRGVAQVRQKWGIRCEELGNGLPALVTVKYPVWIEWEDPLNPEDVGGGLKTAT